MALDSELQTPTIPYFDDISSSESLQTFSYKSDTSTKKIQPLDLDLLYKAKKTVKDHYIYKPSNIGMPYKPSTEIKDYIKKTEGFTSTWKLDSNGKYAIGYGFLETPELRRKYPYKITETEANKEFDKMINDFSKNLEKFTPNWNKLNQNQKDALLSYVYNIGIGNFKNKHPKLLKALKEQDWETAANNIDAGINNRELPGLRKRRLYELLLFLTPCLPNS